MPADPLRARVEDALWAAYGWAARLADGSGATIAFLGPGPRIPPSGLESVDALAALGLLDETEAAVWRERIATPAPRFEARPALRDRLATVLGTMTRAALTSGDAGEARERLQAVLNDLRNLGVLDDEETRWWVSLLLPPQSEEESVYEAEPRPSLERFVRCLPGPVERRRGLRILSIDSFEDATLVHAHVARRGRGPAGAAVPMRDEVEPDGPSLRDVSWLTLEDDLGTTYRYCSGAGGGSSSSWADGPLVYEYLHEFAPAIPARASRLVVRHAAIEFVVPL